MKTLMKFAAAAVLLIFTARAGATILNVNASGGGDYYTVTEALNYAMPGDVVFVHSGTYTAAGGETFPISIPTDVTVVGDETAKPVFTAHRKATVFEIRDESRVVIRAIKISDAGTGICILGNADNVTIDNVVISDCRKQGIVIKNSTNTRITSSVISGTPFAVELNSSGKTVLEQNTLVGLSGHDKSVAVDSRKTGLELRRNIIDGFACGIKIEKTEQAHIIMNRNNIHDCAIPYRHDDNGIRTFTTRDAAGNMDKAPYFVNRNGGDFHLLQHSPLSGLGAFPVNSLPVNFAGIKGEVQYDAVQLNWTTHAEKDNRGWNIYRGFSAEGPFEKINSDLVMGAGNSNSARNYSFYDESLPPMCDDMYYYLEQISSDGATHFSQTVNVNTRMPVTAASEDVYTD